MWIICPVFLYFVIISGMDVYLSSEAYEHLQALSLIATSQNADGLVIGHKRGQCFFVEKVLTTSKGFFPSLEKYDSLSDLFKDKLLGFYSLASDEKKTKKILAPFAYGKLYLDIHMTKTKSLRIKPFRIEYDDTFFLFPLRIKPHQSQE